MTELTELSLPNTPSDELTGLPLSIFVPSEDYRISRKRPDSQRKRNGHHAHHPGWLYELGDDADQMLRLTRVQTLPVWVHRWYHGRYGGPAWHTTRAAKFKAGVLACAGVLPFEAVDVTKHDGSPIITLSREQHAKILGNIHHDGGFSTPQGRRNRNKIGAFFAAYVLEQSVADIVTTREIRQFLGAKDPQRRMQLGNYILSRAMSVSIEPVIETYQRVLEEGWVDRNRRIELPRVMDQYFLPWRRPEYYSELDRILEPAA